MRFKRYLLTFYFLVLSSTATLFSQNKQQLSVIFAGDLMGHATQINSALQGERYNYDTCFSVIKPIITEADIAVLNLEVTLAGPPFKGYPQFSSPDELAVSAKKAGFDLFLTANNHSLDRGKAGLERTLEVLKNEEIIHTGTYATEIEKQKKYPMIIEKNGIRLAILNFTNGTNGIRVESPNIVNYIDKSEILSDLQKAKSAGPDLIIVTMHWGKEYEREPNEEQRQLADFIFKSGADAIIGSHPHVVQPAQKLTVDGQEKLVLYSLGNFISNQRNRYTDGGILFQINIEKEAGNTMISDYSYLPLWVCKTGKETNMKFVLVPSGPSPYLSAKLKMTPEDEEAMRIFDEDTRLHLKDIPLIRWNAEFDYTARKISKEGQ